MSVVVRILVWGLLALAALVAGVFAFGRAADPSAERAVGIAGVTIVAVCGVFALFEIYLGVRQAIERRREQGERR